jgi:CheY-like chemotaxis protein
LYQTKPGPKGKKVDPNVFNLNSPAQLLKKFTALLGEPPMDMKNGKPSASRSALQEYVGDHKVVADYLRWKKVEKRRQMAETLLKNYSEDGFISASYMQLGADTGRMSCISPNLQQVPRDSRFRAAVQAPAGWKLVVADYGQMELRLAAAEAQDPLMTEVFQQGKDLHTMTATQIYGVAEDEVKKEQRQIAKSANFGLLYGSGAKGLRNYAAATGIQMDLDEAAEVRQKFHAAYKGISAWQRKNAAAADAAKDNPSIRIRISGLRRFLPGEHNKLTTRCNTPLQGAGAAVLKLTLGKLWPLLHADGRRLKQILVNLLSNAVKFTPEGGRIHLQVAERADGSRLDFSVRDTGIGIAPEQLPKLFKSFQQIDSALNRKYAGTGLGLALVKRMAEMHGGEVTVESEAGKGALFTVSIPLKPGAVSEAALVRAPSKSPFRLEKFPGSPLILIAEDHPTNRLLLERYLGNRGCRLIFATDGLQAIDRAIAEHPALILMDVQMPLLDGLEATRRLRANPSTAKIPIIALTALARPEDRLRCLEAGADAYLSKPHHLAELDRLMLEHLARA